MLTHITNAQILSPQGWIPCGTISFNNGKIIALSDQPTEITGEHISDAKGCYIIPGGIDLHVHGGGGYDFLECSEEAFRQIVQAHLRHGTTAIYPTLAVAPMEQLCKALDITQRIMSEDGSTIMGAHLEGPYLNPTMAGGQVPEHITLPDPKTYQQLIAIYPCIKRWDAAPELAGSMEFGRYAASHGVKVAVAHTTADYKCISEAYKAGYTHATHFYNAMTGVHKRREYKYEGTIESIYLMDDMSVELIADGVHVPPAILRLVHKIKGVERIALITDAMACAGSDLRKVFDQRVIVEDGVCKLSDRSALAGSITTMDRLIRTMVQQADIPLSDAVRMASETPARLMGIYDRKGSLEVGKDADIVMMDRNLQVQGVWSMGRKV